MINFFNSKICVILLCSLLPVFPMDNSSDTHLISIKKEANKILSYNQNSNPNKVLDILDSLIKYKISDFSPKIIDLYKNCNNYPGSQSIIKNKILRLFIITNDPNGEIVFIDIINSNIIGPELKTLLDCLPFYKNPSDKLINSLISLKKKMEDLLSKTTDEKYQIYFNILSSIENCLKTYSK